MNSNSKFIFALIIFALVVGWIYMIFVPSYRIERNLELNSNYYPGITEESVKKK
jgi:hypothetical protein